MSTIIYATQGAREYVGGTITETTGKDISGATFTVGLTTSYGTPPTEWVAPDVSTVGATTASRVLKMLITDTTAPGDYYLWAKVVDNPEISPLRIQERIHVI